MPTHAPLLRPRPRRTAVARPAPRSARRAALAAALSLVALPALAENSAYCQELWLARNMIFDRAGHCFTSALGQAVFDNADCTGTAALGPEAEADVAAARAVEAWAGCAVDTGATALLPEVAALVAHYRSLARIPIRTEGESGCIGYRGGSRPLHAGPDAGTEMIGMVMTGGSIGYGHGPVDGWDYVIVTDRDGTRDLARGWLAPMPFDESTCEMVAG